MRADCGCERFVGPSVVDGDAAGVRDMPCGGTGLAPEQRLQSEQIFGLQC